MFAWKKKQQRLHILRGALCITAFVRVVKEVHSLFFKYSTVQQFISELKVAVNVRAVVRDNDELHWSTERKLKYTIEVYDRFL